MAGNYANPKRLAQQAGSYDSDFEYDSEVEKKRKKYEDLSKKEKKKGTKKGHRKELEEEYNKEEGRIMRHKIVSMNAFDRHKLLVNNYLMYYSGQKSEFQRDRSKDKTDMDVIRENHRFLWTDDDDSDETWAKRLAKKYYDKLFKEYCIADLSRYKENKVAMRWRIEKEVVQGKGQFICGNKKCNECEGLRSWEVNFAYMEEGQKKNALVKLRLCPDCSYKLNYHHRDLLQRLAQKEIILLTHYQMDMCYKETATSVDPDQSAHLCHLVKISDACYQKKEIKSNKRKHKDETSRKLPATDSEIPSKDERRQCDDSGEREGVTNSDKEEQPSTSSNEAENIWSGPVKIVEEKSREEEFDEYFSDMFL